MLEACLGTFHLRRNSAGSPLMSSRDRSGWEADVPSGSPGTPIPSGVLPNPVCLGIRNPSSRTAASGPPLKHAIGHGAVEDDPARLRLLLHLGARDDDPGQSIPSMSRVPRGEHDDDTVEGSLDPEPRTGGSPLKASAIASPPAGKAQGLKLTASSYASGRVKPREGVS